MLRRKTWWVDSAEHYFQVRLGRRSLALLHFADDAPATQSSTHGSGEALVALFQLDGKHPFVFRNVDAHALANLRFCLAFQAERVFEEDFNERCYAAANLAHAFLIAMAFAVA